MQKEKIITQIRRLKQDEITQPKPLQSTPMPMLAFMGKCYLDHYNKVADIKYNFTKGGESIEALSSALRIFESARKNNDLIYKLLTNIDAIQARIALAGASLISGVREGIQAEYVFRVLTDWNAIKAGIALEGASLILRVKKEFQAEYASSVLTNENAIEAGIALEGANLILRAKKEFQAEYASSVLTNENAIEAGIALEVAKAILTESSEKKGYYISLVASDERIIQADIVLNAVKLIMTSSEEELLQYDKNNIIDFIEKSLDYIGSLISSLNKQPPKFDIKARRLTKPFKKKK